jgi:hypothetical protein
MSYDMTNSPAYEMEMRPTVSTLHSHKINIKSRQLDNFVLPRPPFSLPPRRFASRLALHFLRRFFAPRQDKLQHPVPGVGFRGEARQEKKLALHAFQLVAFVFSRASRRRRFRRGLAELIVHLATAHFTNPSQHHSPRVAKRQHNAPSAAPKNVQNVQTRQAAYDK